MMMKYKKMKPLLLFFAILFVSVQVKSQDSAIVFNPKRQVILEGGSNFRDLGGYPAQNGKIVSWNKIYRSADISKLTENDLHKIEKLNISSDCDLRGPSETKSAPDKLLPNTKYYNFLAGSENLQTNLNYAKINADSMMMAMYTQTDYLKAKYAPLFELLIKTPKNEALLYHCTAGKDRTGMATALIFSSLGVDKKYIIADYLATNIYWKNTRIKMTEMLKKTGMSSESIQKLLDANPSYIQSFLSAIDQRYGSMNHFLITEIGLNARKIRKLKKLYLTDK